MQKEINISAKNVLLVVAMGLTAVYGISGVTTIGLNEGGFAVTMIGAERGKTETLMPGTRWIDPFTKDVFKYDTRGRQYDENLTGICEGITTADGQPICVDLSAEISLSKDKLGELHTNYGPDWYERIIMPKIRSEIRTSTSAVASDNAYTAEGKEKIMHYLNSKLVQYEASGIHATVNLRELRFTNQGYIYAIEEKAIASQKEITAQRNALAAIETAKGVANTAEGEKQKRIKLAEADREERRLSGEGKRLEQEEEAKGIEAIARANAKGTELQVKAYGEGKYYSQVKVAEALGDNFQIWGVPTGAPGTSSIVGLDSIVGKALGATSGE